MIGRCARTPRGRGARPRRRQAVHECAIVVAVPLRPGGEEAREPLAVRLVELADQAEIEQRQLARRG